MPVHSQMGVNNTSHCDVRGHPHPHPLPKNATRPTHLQSISVLVIFSCRFSSLLFHSTRAKPASKGSGLGPIVWHWGDPYIRLRAPSAANTLPGFPGEGKGNKRILQPSPSKSSGWGQQCPRDSPE